MMKPQFTVFGKENLNCLDCTSEVQQLFKAVLEKQPQKKPFAVIVELPYRYPAWKEGGPGFTWPNDPEFSIFKDSSSPVVGLVTEGVMEIYEPEKQRAGRPGGRKKATAVLYPGMFFGLFESYAEPPLRGNWIITSGIVSFLVCNSVGTGNTWNRAGENFGVTNFQFTKRSHLSFEDLISENACSTWCSQSVWLKPRLIDDENLRREVEYLLLKATVRQLTLVVNRSPTWGRVGEGPVLTENAASDEVELWMQYLDAVIDADTPIF